jgi:hypothetical protein
LVVEYSTGNGHPQRVEYGEREIDNGAIINVTEFTSLIGGTSGYLRR